MQSIQIVLQRHCMTTLATYRFGQAFSFPAPHEIVVCKESWVETRGYYKYSEGRQTCWCWRGPKTVVCVSPTKAARKCSGVILLACDPIQRHTPSERLPVIGRRSRDILSRLTSPAWASKLFCGAPDFL
jgi:hypothetical protein